MAELFGIDIAQEVADGFDAAGGVRTGTLTKRASGTRTPGSLSAGTNPSETPHTFQGWLDNAEKRREGQLGTDRVATLNILTATINPAAVPAAGDRFTLDSISGDIVDILEVDPAEALYVCQIA